jgi:hypothetical protein
VRHEVARWRAKQGVSGQIARIQHIMMLPKKVPFLHIYFIAFFDGFVVQMWLALVVRIKIGDLVDRNANKGYSTVFRISTCYTYS